MILQRRSIGILSLLSVCAVGVHVSASQTQTAPPKLGLEVKPFQSTSIYKKGEKVGWTVKAEPGATSYTYQLKKNNKVVFASGALDLASGSTVIETTQNEATMVTLEIKGTEGKPFQFAAVVAPLEFKPVAPRPADFDSFWKSQIEKLRAIPANPEVTPSESGKPNVDYATVKMDHVNGTSVYGQMAKPSRPGKYPAVLILQWASPPYPLYKGWVVDRAAEGWLALNVQPHNVLVSAPAEYYSSLPATLKNYTAQGQEDRDQNYFVEMYLRGFRAVDYLTQHTEWDGKTLLVMGTSMGGQQSLAVAGLHPKVTHMMVNEPAGCDLNADLYGRQGGYPNYPANNPKAMEVAQYIDGINFASRIRAKSLVAMGFVDTVTPPAGIWTAFNLMKGEKEAAPMPESPHNNLATPQQQMPYNRRAGEWMSDLVDGKPIRPKVWLQ